MECEAALGAVRVIGLKCPTGFADAHLGRLGRVREGAISSTG